MPDILPNSSTRVKILDQYWRLRFVGYPELGKKTAGDCALTGPKVLRVATDMIGFKTLDTIIHEIQHAANPALSEDYVRQSSTDIARAILNPKVRLYWDR